MTLVGSLAGLAASVGLVVLSALYVRQRRDIERLRHWASHAAAPSVPTASRLRSRATTAPPATRVRRIGVGAAVTAIAVALVVAAVLGLGPKHRRADHRQAGAQTERPGRVDDLDDLSRSRRGHVPVAVLNASSIGGLAERTAKRLRSLGFAEDVVANAPGPLGSAKADADADGSGPARAIARLLRTGRPVRADQTQRRLAQHAEVIVTVGSSPTG